jgi:hypothetical protein
LEEGGEGKGAEAGAGAEEEVAAGGRGDGHRGIVTRAGDVKRQMCEADGLFLPRRATEFNGKAALLGLGPSRE